MGNGVVSGQRRPAAIAVVAGFLLLASALAAMTGISLLFPGSHLDAIWRLNPSARIAFQRLDKLIAIFLLAIALGTGAAAAGLMSHRKWAWWYAIALFAINGMGDLVTLLLTHDWLKGVSGLLVASVFLFFLAQPKVRQSLR
jgi:hypothetical protein